MKGQKFYYLMSPRNFTIPKTFSLNHPRANILVDYPLFSRYTPFAHIYIKTPDLKYLYVGTYKG